MNHFNIHMDSSITTKIMEACSSGMVAYLTTGYFNLPDLYTESIIKASQANFDVLMAHPTANGFFNAKGLAKGVPFAYTELASQFLNKIISSKQEYRIKMYEYVRPGWTYHAKGLWLSTVENDLPFLTMIGSPNFGERSVKRDLECQFLIATDNKDLQRELWREKELLFGNCIEFTERTPTEADRVPPLWVKAVVLLFRTFL
ncbi:UNVERIFIED_CONTAM: hypothetical protein PYX00_005647 [Menopon gallinae]|uniref:CDP-diacylglycerol--glycerol-3-phosphate 3-phosphatidyltransferase n=1 Tax=Menopon gallinae TaxID=328185 RepID=A0AAW2HU39_9NEOP